MVLQTVERLQRRVRDHRAGYRQSLKVLTTAKRLLPPNCLTKTSLMLGVGESDEEVCDGVDGYMSMCLCWLLCL
jgi:lipoyl synthase